MTVPTFLFAAVEFGCELLSPHPERIEDCDGSRRETSRDAALASTWARRALRYRG